MARKWNNPGPQSGVEVRLMREWNKMEGKAKELEAEAVATLL